MRTEMNPNRLKITDGYSPYIASAIVYLPDFAGYHAQRFEVVKTSLISMRENAGLNCQTLIWDNGSCAEFRDWLLNIFQPDFVVLSKNVGKSIARAGLLRMVPPSTIIGIADDDMYYYPNWFKAQLEVLNHFPNVGQVSGYPVRTQMRWGNNNTKAWGRTRAKYETGRFIPEEWDRDFCTSIGRDYKWHVNYTKADLDHRITYQEMSVYAVAHHCQFICEAGKIAPFTRFDKDAMADEKPFDNAIDAAGLLRLTTTERYTRHIGNVLDEDLKQKPKRKRHA